MALRVRQTQRMKNLFDFRFFKTLVTQNHNSAFKNGFYLRQAVH